MVRSPKRLAHIALRTRDLDALIAWYGHVLGATVAFRSESIAFLTYDEEHHRLAIIASDKFADRASELTVGYYHTAFGYESLADLMSTYERLLAMGIQPYRTINHGPTVSLYYEDPDKNQIELHVDSFPDAEATNAWMRSPEFRNNPIGIDFDPQELIAKLKAGVPEVELLRRPDRIHSD